MLPVCFLYLLVTRRLRLHDGWLIAGFGVILSAELLYYFALYGDPLYRFTTLGATYITDPMLRAANSDLTYRLIKAYPAMFFYPSTFGLFGPLMIAAGIYSLVHFRRTSFFLIWAAIILIFYNFMSARLDQYVALPVSPRLLAPACVPLLILSAKLLVDLWRWLPTTPSVLGRSMRVAYSAGLILLVLSSLLVVYLNTNTGLTPVLARNASTAARFFAKEPRIVILADRRSAQAIHFYRQFNQRDSILDFKAAPQLLASTLVPDSDMPLSVVLNGPIINESKLTFKPYGGSLSLDAEDHQFIQRFIRLGTTPVFSARFQKSPLFEALMQYPVARSFMGSFNYQQARALLNRDSPLSQIQIFRRAADK